MAVALGLGLAQSAGAHHSFAVFFNTDAQLVKITGVVRDFQFRNPHGVITLAVTKGKDQITWRAETNSPSVLRRRGWTRTACMSGIRSRWKVGRRGMAPATSGLDPRTSQTAAPWDNRWDENAQLPHRTSGSGNVAARGLFRAELHTAGGLGTGRGRGTP